MRILITGIAGYVGAITASRLIDEGHSVRGVDKLSFGGLPILDLFRSPEFSFVRGDIRDTDVLATAVQGVDAVVHLAAIVGDPACAREPHLAREINLNATRMLHQACANAGVKHLVFASTCSVYGQNGALASETTTPQPLSVYAETKLAAEAWLLSQASGPQITALRFGTLFGLAPRTRFDLVINRFTRQAITEGHFSVFAPEAWRPYVHIADIAGAIRAALVAPDSAGGEVFNVVQENLQLRDVADLIVGVCGGAYEIRPTDEDRRDYHVSGDKLKALLGFTPAWTIERGVRELRDALTAGLFEVPEGGLYANA